LITYLLMAIYCREQFNEKVSIKRVRELRTSILNELFNGQNPDPDKLSRNEIVKDQKSIRQAKT
ncbi:MAG: IS4 family transposase, partial [Proteobacteria bacterium]|nr:IS4 family transposase [Pseudomonadota bacterium]